MVGPAVRMCFADQDTLRRDFETDLQHGRAFVHGAHGVCALDDCVLILVHPDDQRELQLSAQAVFVGGEPAPAVGVQMRPFDAEIAQRVRGFVFAAEAADEPAPAVAESEQQDESSEPSPEASADDAAPEAESELEADACEEGSNSDVQQQPSRQERLRKLNQTQQQKMARSGSLNDRVMLERIYGRNVWESLLHNPKLSIPEVATIARKGSVPRPLLEFIVENNTWISAPIVRRALLGNPRVNAEAILKLLRLTPKHELKTIHKTTTYSTQVRDAARKVLENA